MQVGTQPHGLTHTQAGKGKDKDSHLKAVFIQNDTKVGIWPKIVIGQVTSLLSSHFVLAHSPLEVQH